FRFFGAIRQQKVADGEVARLVVRQFDWGAAVAGGPRPSLLELYGEGIGAGRRAQREAVRPERSLPKRVDGLRSCPLHALPALGDDSARAIEQESPSVERE